MVQPTEANELGRIKADDLLRTDASIIASANIGCTLQLRRHLEDGAKVHHPMELLAASAGLHQLSGLEQSFRQPKVAGERKDR